MESIKVGEVARRAGVNLQTIRYYERRGLLPRPPRTRSNYRAYPAEAVLRVRFIKRAQELGFSLADNLLGGGNTLAASSELDGVVVEIDGMTCEACAAIVENALESVPGVAAAEVSYRERGAIVGVTRGSQPPRQAILSAIARAADYRGRFADQVQWTLGIEGMTCEGCAASLQSKLAGIPGVSGASVSYEQG
jgi:copper chaperone CopZ